MPKIDHQLFHVKPQSTDHGLCPECDAPLLVRHGKHGPFIACSAYPSCVYIKKKVRSELSQQILEQTECPVCHALLALKSGRYGFYISCSNHPTCPYTVKEQPQAETRVFCPECKTSRLIERTSRYGKKFYACENYPKCKYAVNHQPVDSPCPHCQWPILVKKEVRGKKRLICPQRSCKYQIEKI